MVLTLLFFSSLPRARQKKIKIKAELSDCPWGKKKKKVKQTVKDFCEGENQWVLLLKLLVAIEDTQNTQKIISLYILYLLSDRYNIQLNVDFKHDPEE